jgi:hypothetical protein
MCCVRCEICEERIGAPPWLESLVPVLSIASASMDWMYGRVRLAFRSWERSSEAFLGLLVGAFLSSLIGPSM